MDRHDPFESMDRLFEQMRRSMMDMRRQPTALPGGSNELVGGGEADFDVDTRNIRLERTEEGFVAMADLPGFEPDEITVAFDDGMLSLTASHEDSETDETSVRRRTRRVDETLRIPGDVDVDAIDGTYRNGVLEVTIPTLDGDDDAHVIDLE